MALTQISTAGVKDDAVTSGKIPANAVGSSEIADQAVTLAKLPHGTSSNNGKFLRANNGADPSFETVTSTTINNNADNRVITGSGTANTLEGESTLTYGGTELLISNASPSVKLNDTDNSGVVDINNVGGAAVIESTGVTTFATNGSERMRIDSSGKVGIGETSMDALLVIKGNSDASTTPSIRLKDGTDTREAWISNTAGDLVLANGGNDNTPHCKLTMYDGNIMQFSTGNTERMRIDLSGRVGLGHNLSGASDYNRLVVHNPHSGSSWMQLTSTASGNGINTDGLAIGLNTANTGHIWLRENSDLVFATNGTKRMSILAGGGLAFNNDTAQANALDDYEEGTWTPTCTQGTLNYGHNSYTKIGRMCYITTYVNNFSDRSSSNVIEINNLPFAPANESDVGACVFYRVARTDDGQVAARTSTSGNKILFLVSSQGGSESWFHLTHSDLNHAHSQIKFSIWYAVA